MTQRIPTDKEREHLEWIHAQIGKIQLMLGPVPHEIATKLISLTDEIEADAFDPFGEIVASCESCDTLILTCDEGAAANEDGNQFCEHCVRSWNDGQP